MNEELLHECFGHCRGDDDCRDCDLRESCSCISETESTIDNGYKLVSFEALENWAEFVAEEPRPPEEEPDARETPELAALSEFCRYILHLDSYTLGILAEIIAPESAQRDIGIADLARLHRCSRQAMHRKMLASARRHPELAGVLQTTLRKIGRSRNAFHRREVKHAG